MDACRGGECGIDGLCSSNRLNLAIWEVSLGIARARHSAFAEKYHEMISSQSNMKVTYCNTS